MIYIRTGLPGASKTLNSIKELVHSYEQNRAFYYHNIRLLILDIDVARSFSGWYYGWYFPRLTDKSLKRKLIKIMKPIHDNDEFLTLDDVPFLRSLFESHNHFDTWYYWIKRCYPKKHLQKLDNAIDGAIAVGQELTEDELFDLVKPLNFDFKYFDDPNYWFDLPKGSKILIDECQQFFPPRSVGSRVPQAISKLETHRHGGYDLHFVTQDATLADQNLRKLVGRHIHFYNPFGGKTVTRKENPEVFNPKDYHQNKQAIKKSIKHPKEFYGAYYSAEIHTHKIKIPKILIWLLVLPLVMAACLYYVYDSLFADKIKSSEKPSQNIKENAPQSAITGRNQKTDVVGQVDSQNVTVRRSVDSSDDSFRDSMAQHLETLSKDVYINGANGVYQGGHLERYDYSFHRSSDGAIFTPTLAGIEVNYISECLATFTIGGVTKMITCDPFYKRVPVSDDENRNFRFKSDAQQS